jgi:hypothetical protein
LVEHVITYFTDASIGKADDKYFQSIPKNWFPFCRDVDLGVLYDPTRIRLKLQVWLSAPPYEVDGNDIVTIHNGKYLNVLLVLHRHQNNLLLTEKMLKKNKQ